MVLRTLLLGIVLASSLHFSLGWVASEESFFNTSVSGLSEVKSFLRPCW